MGEPATAAGLALAVVPLIISALENYQNVFEPFIIFKKKYKEEVKRFQDLLRVQNQTFCNECGFLLDGIAGAGYDMVDNRDHWRWQDPELEIKLRSRLDKNYDACVAAVRRVRVILDEILDETKTLEILQQKKVSFIHTLKTSDSLVLR